MTLRQLLHSLATDEAARTEFLSDPTSALARSGFDGLGEELLGTALVHHTETAPVEQLDGLVPLLDRFAPLPDHPRSTQEILGPEDHLVADVDPGVLFDDLGPVDPDPAPTATEPTDDEAPPTTSPSGPSGHAPGDLPDDPSHGDFGTGAVPVIATDSPPPGPTTPELEPEWSADAAEFTTQVDIPPPLTDHNEEDGLPPERAVDDAPRDEFDAVD